MINHEKRKAAESSPLRAEFNLDEVVLYEWENPNMKLYITPYAIKKEEERRQILKKRYIQAKKTMNERKTRQKDEDNAMNDLKSMARLSREERKTMMYIKQIEEMEKNEQKKNNKDERFGDLSLNKKSVEDISDDDLDSESGPSKKLKTDHEFDKIASSLKVQSQPNDYSFSNPKQTEYLSH